MPSLHTLRVTLRHPTLSLLFCAGVLGGCATHPVYVLPQAQKLEAAQGKVNKPLAKFETEWLEAALLRKGYRTSVFLLKDGRIEVTFDGRAPDGWVDCGREVRELDYGVTKRTFDSNVATRYNAYEEYFPDGTSYFRIHMVLNATAIVQLREAGDSTQVSVTANYRVQRTGSILQKARETDFVEQNARFTTQSYGTLPGNAWLRSHTCYPTGKLEQDVLETIQQGA